MTYRLMMNYDELAKYFKVENGQLIRLIRSANSMPNTVVGSPNNQGYLKFNHKGKSYFVHRAIYLLTHKTCPEFIDHVNGIVSDNRLENLRVAEITTNAYNQKLRVDNVTGCKGVHQLKDGAGYQAKINYNGKKHFLGTFKTYENAKEFVSLARDMVHGAFANHGVTA